MTEKDITSAFDSFRVQKILIIGDVILDAYYHGRVDRISPEAPVSILDVEHKEYRLGGAANVALNVLGLGAAPILCSVIGNDTGGQKISSLLRDQGIDDAVIISSQDRTTSVKTRLVSGNRQIMRVDEERTDLLNDDDEQRMIDLVSITIAKEKPSAVIFEDYDKGVIGLSLITKTIEICRAQNIPVTVDPKRRNFLSYSGASLFKPNLKELREGLNNPSIAPNEGSLKSAYDFLTDVMPVEMALFTLSSHGMYITDGENSTHIPTEANNIADVSGAGDTVIAVATCALAAKLSLTDIATMANVAAGIVCKQPGVVSIDKSSLKTQLTHK